MGPGSLTLRLQNLTTNFNVEVLRHEPGAISNEERVTLQRESIFSNREVLLRNAHVPWVFARSLIPQEGGTLINKLQGIGNSPLGQELFTHDQVTPGEFSFACFAIDSEMSKYNQQLGGRPQVLWGRRRVFWIEQDPILVAEVFLSHAPCYVD